MPIITFTMDLLLSLPVVAAAFSSGPFHEHWLLLVLGTLACHALIYLICVHGQSQSLTPKQRPLGATVSVAGVLAFFAFNSEYVGSAASAFLAGWAASAVIFTASQFRSITKRFVQQRLGLQGNDFGTGGVLVTYFASIQWTLFVWAAGVMAAMAICQGTPSVFADVWWQVITLLKPTMAGFWQGLILYPVYLMATLLGIGLTLIAYHLLGHNMLDLDREALKTKFKGAYDLAIWGVIAMAVTAGIFEEVSFRGMMQATVGFWIPALVFAVGHFDNPKQLPRVVALFAGSVVLGASVIYFNSLWPAIIAHTLLDCHPEKALLEGMAAILKRRTDR